jgi:hypothetical protein
MFGTMKVSRGLLKPGDVIIAQRICYHHYGIYAGRGRVIHFAGEKGDFLSDVKVRETTLAQFARGDSVFVCIFPKIDKNLFSCYDTLQQAKSKLGKTGFNLVFNNCEHFARWCKTGQKVSFQVQYIMDSLIKGLRNFESKVARNQEA